MLSKLLIFNLGTGEIILIALVILLLFGGRKIGELMKGLRNSVKSVKQGVNEVEADIKEAVDEADKKPADKE
jgi:sec-independent protein translocase protein TatA